MLKNIALFITTLFIIFISSHVQALGMAEKGTVSSAGNSLQATAVSPNMTLKEAILLAMRMNPDVH